VNGKEMVSCRQSVAGRSGSRQSGAYRALGQEENVGREMVGAICSPAELSKCVGVVLTSVVDVLSVRCALTFRKSRRKCPRRRTTRRPSRHKCMRSRFEDDGMAKSVRSVAS